MNIKKPLERVRVQIRYQGDQAQSVTDRSFGNDTDVNKIVARFARTGEFPGDSNQGQFADVTGLQGELTDLIGESREALEKYKAAEKALEDKQAAQIVKNAEELEQLRQFKIKHAEAMKPEPEGNQ